MYSPKPNPVRLPFPSLTLTVTTTLFGYTIGFRRLKQYVRVPITIAIGMLFVSYHELQISAGTNQTVFKFLRLLRPARRNLATTYKERRVT
jgi:hypothetical protein